MNGQLKTREPDYIIKTKKKRNGGGIGNRITTVIVGVIIALCSMIPVSEGMFGRTGYIVEIRSSERSGGAREYGSTPNSYEWTVGYTFKTESGEYETGSVTVNGDAVSSKSGLRVGSPVRYLAFAPRFNRPGEGRLDGTTFMYLLTAAFGVYMVTLGVRKK